MKNNKSLSLFQRARFAGRCMLLAALSMLALGVAAQNKAVSGTVVDDAGEPIIGASVVVQGTTNGTITDFDGKFSLQNVPNDGTIEVSYVGYTTQSVSVAGKSLFNITLKEDSEMLDEVVVVGFGTQKKVNLTGSVGIATAKDIESRPVTNATQALQGLVPGLQISQTAGSLEDTPSINIRGTTTIGEGSSGDPLILIDGMEGDLNTINPQDIASISVLKDAAASSIYGSRAPFGVILITTKQGSTEGKTSINYNNSFRWSSPINGKHMLNSVDFASWMNDTFTNGGSDIYFDLDWMADIVAYHNAKPYQKGSRITSDGTIMYAIEADDNGEYWLDGYGYGIDDVDWYDVVYKNTTFSQEHNFSVSGGTQKLNYYASFNYLDQGGLMNLGDEGLDRYNVTAKVGAELTKWLRFNYTMRFTRQDYIRPASLTSSLYSDMARQGWPTLPLYDRNGYYYSSPSPALGLAEGGYDSTQTDNTYQQVSLKIEPIKNWITHIDFNYRIQSQNRHWESYMTYNHDVNGNPYVYNNSSNVYEEQYKENYYNFNVYSEYSLTLKEKHNFHVMVGFQAEELNQTDFSLQNYGILDNDKAEIDLTTGLDYYGNAVTPSVSGNRNSWSTAGFFGRLNYDYEGKYLAEVNLRYDGTSRFRKGNQWKLFPSFSLGWNIAREAFFEPVTKTVDMLKLRLSYGSLGNQNTDNWYPTYQTLTVGSSDSDWLFSGSQANTAYSPDLVSASLGWETIETYNIGLDFGLFKNRLTGSFDFYVRNTKDMVGPAPALPAILGTDVPVTNNTDLRTTGWELTLSWNDRLSNGLYYSAKFNISDARSKVTRYPNNPTGSISSYIEGRYINEIWGYTTVGLAKTDDEMDAHLATMSNGGQDALGSSWAAGDIMYKDSNGDGKVSSGSYTESDPGDLKVIGNSTPRFLFGLDLSAQWKGFDVRIFFQGVMKRDYWQGSTYLFGATSSWQWWATGIKGVEDYFRNDDTWSVQNGFQKANTNAYLPRPIYDDKNLQEQTRYLQNAAYIRLKNLQVGYTIPAKITQRWGIQNVRIYVSGENLWTGTSLVDQFDPETISSNSGNGYPLQRTYACGLSVTF